MSMLLLVVNNILMYTFSEQDGILDTNIEVEEVNAKFINEGDNVYCFMTLTVVLIQWNSVCCLKSFSHAGGEGKVLETHSTFVL